MTIHTQLEAYLTARGIPMPADTTRGKLLEELRELTDAIAAGHGPATEEEIADVVLAAAVIAHTRGVTVEGCIALKTGTDTGRGPKVPTLAGRTT